MMVVSSFDLWQKDAFFSAAEEVQESADVMESVYRMWIKEMREGQKSSDAAELCRGLQTALGTAKWQLEEFERAIRLSCGHGCDDNRASRHKQFIAAIESQICRVEAALKEAIIEEGKQPLRWVDLDKQECDDLAMFLSGTSPSLQQSMENTLLVNSHRRKDTNPNVNATCNRNMPEVKSLNDFGKDVECLIDVEDERSSGKTDDVSSGQDRTTSTRRTWSTPNFGSLKIVIADEYADRNQMRSGMEATPKEKGSKPFFSKQRCGELTQAKCVFNLFNRYPLYCIQVESNWLLCPVDHTTLGNPLLTTVVMVASFPVVFEMMWSWLIQELDVILYLLAIYSVLNEAAELLACFPFDNETHLFSTVFILKWGSGWVQYHQSRMVSGI
ncbi:hypothetical protein GOBAR_AA31495 [Gossypium barbadense]|uniref:Syntaxin 6/10/61 N-terminal domain-containing protein n=1 Tax=Gossypium barbadense TaxID=3634 RepID=A0A2P5WDN6_GOSBA|nr:hypothetical protein GOBAR_AA31495 [Gossypium barbadense]